MRRIARIILVLATSVATLFGVALNGNVLCFAADGHAAIEPPHPDGRHDDHHDHDHDCDHQDSERGRDDSGTGGGDCTDLSVDSDVARDVPARSVDAPHVEMALPPQVAPVDGATKPATPLCLPGLGTHPPAPGDLDCLRGIILLV